MAKFGAPDLSIDKDRKVDNSESLEFKDIKKKSESSEAQRVADLASVEVLLAVEKNAKVRNVSIAIAEQNVYTYIRIPEPASVNSFDPTSNVSTVRRALRNNFNTQSEGGSVIRFQLFKDIVDSVVHKQSTSISDIFGGLDAADQADNLNEINIGALGALLNSPTLKVSDFVSHNANSPAKDDGKSQLIALAIGALSIKLIDELNKLQFMVDAKKKRDALEIERKAAIKAEDVRHRHATKLNNLIVDEDKKSAAIGAENIEHLNRLTDLGIGWKVKLVKLLASIAKAYAMYALIHDIKSAPMRDKWDAEVRPLVDPELADEYREVLTNLYEYPDEEMKLLLQDDDGTDPAKVIIEYCMSYIQEFNGRNSTSNFTSWIIYLSATVKDMDLLALQAGVDTTSSFSTKYTSTKSYTGASTPGPSSVDYAQGYITPNTSLVDPSVTFAIPKLETSKYIPDKIQGFFGSLPGGKAESSFELNIMDYLDVAKQSAGNSSDESNMFMSLMMNGKYSPELVCCLINYMVDGNINDAKAVLQAMQSVLSPVQLNYGTMIEDVLNRLFGGIKAQLLNYVVTQLHKFVDKQRNKLRGWLAKIIDDDEFTRFCTPLIDIIQALIRALDQWEQLIAQFLRELADHMLTFNIDLDGGVLTLHTANKNRMLNDLITSLLAAINAGKLCNYKAQEAKDIHPDALSIIASNSALLSKPVTEAVESFNDISDEIRAMSESFDDHIVGAFTDPDDPELIGAISVNRPQDGLSMIETLVEFSGNCNSLEDNQGNLTMSDIL